MKNSDELIKKKIVDSLYWDNRVDASEVKVVVDDRSVIIRGTVPNYAASEAALFDAWRIHGVVKVDNQLLVKYPSNVQIPSDKEIAAAITQQISWNDSTRTADIQVSVNKGTVTLEGHVDAYWKKTRVQNLVSGMVGVVRINNKLTVVPTKALVDDVIADDIVKAMDRNYSVDVNQVDIRVEDGIVTLSGKVSNRRAYDEAIEVASNTFGVVDVVDRLAID
jgi:osmotically-inducible protein OsmY